MTVSLSCELSRRFANSPPRTRTSILEPPITHSGLTILWILYEPDILQLLGLPGPRTLYMRQRMNGRDDDVSHRFLSTTLKASTFGAEWLRISPRSSFAARTDPSFMHAWNRVHDLDFLPLLQHIVFSNF
ncbi:hypothetical protein C8J57DRAFT_1504282 [Mycena rebaudengoi]|nr:hypothetical protein C8J57DRAFT_1504282 [Mycena rebaudengoi]